MSAGGAVLAALALAGALAAACARPPEPGAPAGAPAGPQRVVLVTIDTLRADYVGCYGSERARTPTLDSIAASGVRFATAVAPTPITLPSHTSLLTGLDPPRHGVHHNTRFALPADVPTLAERFAAAGFATAAFVGSVVLDRRYGLDRGFGSYDDRMRYGRTKSGWGGHGERRADQVVDSALAWLEGAPERFFLWIHLYDPHANYDPPPGYRPRSLRTPRAGAGFAEQVAIRLPPFYAGEIAFADAELGRLLGALDARFAREGTLVAVTSDHGESLGEHGEFTHTLGVYDATQRVPLLLAGPGVAPGRVVEAPVRLVDVAPTLLALAGAPALPEASGVDLAPWMAGERDDPLEAYVETMATWLDFGWSPLVGLRTGDTKLVRSPRPELYDLATDPAELRNRAPDEPERLARLDAALGTRLRGARAAEPVAALTGQERAQLEALGYLVPARERALPELGWVGEPDPKDRVHAVAAMLEAHSLLEAGQAQRALDLLAGVPEAGGFIAETRAHAALEQGDAEAALRHAREAVSENPERPDALHTLGLALEALGRSDEAALVYQRAADLDPTVPEPLAALGRLAEARGDRATAVAFYERAHSGAAPSAEAALALAALHFEQGEPGRARALVAEAWSGLGASNQARIRLARAEARAGYPDLALQRLDEAYRRDPSAEELAQAYAEIRREFGALHFPKP